jgi:hypothetical protein
LDPEAIKIEDWGPSGTLAKEQGSAELIIDYGAKRARQYKAQVHRDHKVSNPMLINQSNSLCEIVQSGQE